MFSKAKSGKAQDTQKLQAVPSEAPVSVNSMQSSGKRNAVRTPSSVPSIISADVAMRGNVNSAGEIQFDGQLEGDIKAMSLIIGEKAAVKGEVVCETVTVRGEVEGGIRAKSVSLASTARIRGDILHSSLSVENGAHFEGNCRHSDDPLSESSAKDFRRSRPAPAPAPSPRPASASQGNDEPETAKVATPSFLNQNRSPLR
ncbi:MAG: polymer-forming cytoskeletal protein [Pseudomonadota bacterium]